MGQNNEGSVGSFPGFSMDTTWACFHAGVKCCLRKTALKIFVKKVIARFCWCLRSLFGILFGSGALPTLIPLMACRFSDRLVKFVSLVEHTRMRPRRTNNLNNGRITRVIHRLNLSLKAIGQGFRILGVWDSYSSRHLQGWAKEWEIAPSMTTGPHSHRIPGYRSTVRSSTRSADRSLTTGDCWLWLSEWGSLATWHCLLNCFFRRVSSY
jgi:hypothetical protein